MEGVEMDDAFVENDFVSLGFFDHFQGFGVCAPFDHVWIVHRDGLWFFQRFCVFVDDIGFEKVKFNWVCPRALRVNLNTLR